MKNVRGYYNNSISVEKIQSKKLYGREKNFPFEISLYEKGIINRLYLSRKGLIKLKELIDNNLMIDSVSDIKKEIERNEKLQLK